MNRTVLVRAVIAACLLSVSTSSLVAAAPPILPGMRYIVDGVYQSYETTGGFYSTGMGCVGPCSTSIQAGYSWSNSWSATISFSQGPIDATVGYNTGAGGSVSYTQGFVVPSGKSGVIWYADYYMVQKMYVHTESCYPAPGPCTYKYGTATAKKWLKRLYSLRLS